MPKSYRLDFCRTDKFDRTVEGFLKTETYATRAGVFYYIDEQDQIRAEFRPPEEVFKAESMDSLAGKPATNDHPFEFVTTSNARFYSVGFTGEKTKKVTLDDGFEYLWVPLTVLDQETIDDVLIDGKSEVSCGYTCDIYEESGEWNGEKYDCVQRNIVYNHLAIVDRGRAGPNARIKLDAMPGKDKPNFKYAIRKDELELLRRKTTDSENRKDKIMKTRFTVDGVTYETEDSAMAQQIQKLVQDRDALKVKCDAAEADLKTAKSDNEKMQGKYDGLQADIEKIKKEQPTRSDMLKIARERNDLEEFSKKILGEDFKFDAFSDLEIKKAVLEKHSDASFKEKSDDWVEGRFGGLKDSFKADVAEKGDVDDAFNKRDEKIKADAGDDDYETVRDRCKKADSEAWKNPINPKN